MNARDLIISHEGFRSKVYDDQTGLEVSPGITLSGHPTIGYGRCLDLQGLSASEAATLLDNDIDNLFLILHENDWFTLLTTPRQYVIVDMAYNMGTKGLYGFKEMIAALAVSDYSLAADHMMTSRWAQQVPNRAKQDADIMRSGLYEST